MAATAPASAADSLTVPDWIKRNSQIFRAHPAGVDRSRSRVNTTIVVPVINEESAAACMAAMLIDTEFGSGWIEAPIGLQPPSYFRDLSNHPNILATLVYTARRTANFFVDAMGQQLTPQEWRDYINKFNAWLNALDAFWFYITLIDHQTESTENKLETSDAIVDSLSKYVLLRTASNEIDDEAKKEVGERINKTFELASAFMAEKNITTSSPTNLVKAGFQHEAFGLVGATQTTIPITFTTATLSKSNQSSTFQYSSTFINKFTFQLNSANIIANAETLAQGTTLISTKQYCDYINGPLDAWAQGAPTSST